MKQLMQEQLPFVELMGNGFSNRYKPGGNAFYSVAENRHVQMTCWTYKYGNNNERSAMPFAERQRAKNDNSYSMSREMCLVMNELVRIISGVADDWWK